MFGLNHRDAFLITRILLLSRSECVLKPLFKMIYRQNLVDKK